MTASTLVGTHVEVQKLVVRFKRTTALDEIDLDLGPGVHGLLGPNGAGKMTLTRVLATVAKPTSGRVSLLRRDLSDQRTLRHIRRRLGFVPQQFGFYPRFTVREFVEYFAWLKEMPAASVPLAVDRAIERVGLSGRADDKLKRLSGGMVRRAGIAQAIVNDPDLLLLDEPTAGLDPEQRVAFRELLREMGVNACVLVATHLVEDVTAACTHVTLVNAGRAVFRGTPDDFDLGRRRRRRGGHPDRARLYSRAAGSTAAVMTSGLHALRTELLRGAAPVAGLSTFVLSGLMLYWLADSWAGLLVVVVAGAALIAPVATYGGGGWWWVLALTLPALAMLTAIGVAVGRLVPSHVAGPVAAIAIYALMVLAFDDSDVGIASLLPTALSNYDAHAPGSMLAGELGVRQLVWWTSLTAVVLVLVVARRRWPALVPAVCAAIAAGPLLQGQNLVAWRADPDALALVCAEGAPNVCLTRINAFLLDDITAPVRQELARWDGVPAGPVRAVDGIASYAGQLREDDATISIQGAVSLTGAFTGPVTDGPGLVSWGAPLGCDGDAWERHRLVIGVAYTWGDPEVTELEHTEPDIAQARVALLGMAEPEQKAWMGRYIDAAATCDEPALDALASELS